VDGVDLAGKTVITRQLRRGQLPWALANGALLLGGLDRQAEHCLVLRGRPIYVLSLAAANGERYYSAELPSVAWRVLARRQAGRHPALAKLPS
jgi:hypothetical protein